MISIKIKPINQFMNELLVKDTFDSFLVSDIEIMTANTYNINGRINKSFFNEENNVSNEDFTGWDTIKPICFQIIKGKNTPTKIKIVFQLSKNAINQLIIDSNIPFTPDQVSGLYMHVLFENNEVIIITGTSLSIFSMDKSLDRFWDNYLKTYLSNRFEITVD